MRCFKFIRWILLGTLLCLVPSRALHAQVITSFSPEYGSPGDSIAITGSGFTASTTVRFWNNQVASRFVNGNTLITATVPGGVSTGPISVQNPGGSQNYSGELFTVIDPWAYIEQVDPNYGAVGDTILIYGVHFYDSGVGTLPVVKFGGVSATAVPNLAGTMITTYVPSGAPSSSLLTVTALGGTYTNPEPFVVVGAGPYIAGFIPPAGPDSTEVTLTGLHFTGLSSVKFNGKTATLGPYTDKQITAYAPAGVTTGPITVTTSSGSHTSSTPFYGPIHLTDFNPSSGQVGSQVIITGTNFTNATAVKFGGFTGVNAAFVVSNNNQIVATVPTNAPTGPIAVFTPFWSLSFATNDSFVITPTIISFTPHAGAAGTPVQLTGTRLVDNGGGAPTVKFNGVNGTVTDYSSQLVLVTAPASSSGFITLTTADGTIRSSQPFYYPPVITGFTPNASPPGTMISISGQSLTNTSSVLFNGVPSTNFTVLNNTSIQAKVPIGITTGPLTVTTPWGTTNSSSLYYVSPIITAFAPGSGGVGASVTVFGTSFQGTTAVKFNGVEADFGDVTANQLTAVVPLGASTGPISVTAPAGTATSAADFVVALSSDLQFDSFVDAPDPVTLGEDLTLTIKPSNEGPNTASGVTASVAVDPDLMLKSVSTTQGSVNTNGNPIVFSIGTMTTNSLPTLTMVLAPQAVGSVTNTVTLSSSVYDPNPDNNVESRVTTVSPAAELSIARTGIGQVRIAWPIELTNWFLQSTPSLTNPPPWSLVTTPIVIVGDERVVTEPGTGVTKAYRLWK